MRLYNWSEICEYVSQLPYQENVWVPEEDVAPPEVVGIPYSFGAYRFTHQDGRAIDIKKKESYYLVHWERYNPSTHLIEHAVYDAPLQWLIATTAVGAIVSPKGKEGEGALKGLGWGLALGLLLKAMLSKN